jgi:phosphatidylserine decarboxylase
MALGVGSAVVLSNDAFLETTLRGLPTRALSRLWGCVTHTELPEVLRGPLYKLWGGIFNSDLSESRFPLHTYISLAEFFTRPLRDNVRPIERDSSLVSPVDAVVLSFGELENGSKIDQVKGKDYSLHQLLGIDESSQFQDKRIKYCTLYLAPGDYHRIHGAANWNVDSVTHVVGRFWRNPESLMLIRIFVTCGNCSCCPST